MLNPACGEPLTCRRLPANASDAVETNQADFRTQPEIAVRRLGNGVNGAFAKALVNSPLCVRVLPDIERWVYGESATAASQQDGQRQNGVSVRSPHAGILSSNSSSNSIDPEARIVVFTLASYTWSHSIDISATDAFSN
jgi:hypothetical protein